MLDIRMLPDENVDEFYEKLAAVIDDPRVEIVPEHIYRPAAPPSEIDNEMFRVLEDVALRMYPDATVLPIMSTGATDMAQVRARGMQAYGIGPARSIEERNSGYGAHGDNERIEEEAFVELVKYMWNVVIEIVARANDRARSPRLCLSRQTCCRWPVCCLWDWDVFCLLLLFWCENVIIGLFGIARMVVRRSNDEIRRRTVPAGVLSRALRWLHVWALHGVVRNVLWAHGGSGQRPSARGLLSTGSR